MKKLNTLALLLFLFFVSCNKTSGCKLNINDQFDSNPTLKDQPTGNKYSYSCRGDCTGGGQCEMVHFVQQNYVECSCEGCVLNVTIETAEGTFQAENPEELIELLLSKYLYLDELQSFIKTQLDTDEFFLTNIELYENEGGYYLLYDYSTNMGAAGSIMYATSASGEKFQIDCRGSCDGEGETCRERFVFNPRSAECTCESDNCSMTITQVD